MHFWSDIFVLVLLNSISNAPKSWFCVIFTLDTILGPFSRVPHLKSGQKATQNRYRTAACMVLGPDLKWDTPKNDSKNIFRIKIMQNRDFGALEMLFSSTRTNIPGQKFIWMGENKYTNILFGFWLVWTRFAWSGLTYVSVGTWYVSGGSSELEILKILYFSSTSVEPKIYLYLVDFNFFWFSEKLWVWKARKSCLCSPWAWPTPLLRENVKRFSAKIRFGPPGWPAPP